MDKAKQAAKQAQQMLDEQQAKFNQSQGQGAPSQPPSGTSYDQHGRPERPAGSPAPAATPDPASAPGPAATPDPLATPGPAATPDPVATPDPAATGAGQPPGEDPAAPLADDTANAPAPQQQPADDSLNATPDPFRPIGG